MPDYQDTIISCSRMLVGSTDLTGRGRQISAPLLSVFLGQDAEAHREDVFSAYQNCWPSAAKALGSLTVQDYCADSVLLACSEMLSARLTFKNYSTVYLAYYWDVMDDRFDTFFQAVQQPVPFPPVLTVETFFFVFCREFSPGAREKKEKRLKQLISWAQETGRHLTVLSDFTSTGLLGPDEIGESYRLAANVLLISDTYFSPPEKDLGRELTFFLSQGPVYSASYYVLKKNALDIAAVLLWQILDDYQHLPDASCQTRSVKEGLCGPGNGYEHLFQTLFDQKLSPLLPQDTTFLGYLPYTNEMRRLDDSLNGVQAGFSLFGRRSTSRTAGQGTDAALISIRSIWEACLERYYRRPVFAWLESPEGETYLQEFFRQKLNLALDFEAMSRQLLPEAEELEKLAQNQTWILPKAAENMPLHHWLHYQARLELESAVYGRLARCLAQAMRRMHSYASGFDQILTQTKQNLQIEHVEPSVRTAYGVKTHNLLAANHDLLACKISPCSDETTLLEQAAAVFQALVQMDPAYRYSLNDHFSFLIGSAALTDVGNIIGAYFNQNMDLMGRLQTCVPPGGNKRMYCMVSQGNFEERIDSRLHGDVFTVPRTDCIERLMIYPIKPESIIY